MADQDYFSQFAAPSATPRPARPSAQDDPFAEFAEAAAPKAEGTNPWLVGAGALGVGALALAARNPGMLKTGLNGVLQARKASMLSGLALPKSLAGAGGAAMYGSIERGSLAPLREMFSRQTLDDAVTAFKRGPNQATAGPATGMSKWNLPGRLMGAGDEAAQNALQRAGYSAEDAAREMLQAPIPDSVGKRLDNPVADFLIPFRKTPLNSLLEGMNTFGALGKNGTAGQRAALGTSMATGAASGALAEDPKTIGITTAASGRYGLPHAMAAGAARYLTSGSKRKGIDVIDAVSDFGSSGRGVIGAFDSPQSAIGMKPAAIPALQYLRELLGMK
jgi:hypothetical protein